MNFFSNFIELRHTVATSFQQLQCNTLSQHFTHLLQSLDSTALQQHTRGGSRISRQPSKGRRQYTNFPKNCMKLRKFWSVGGVCAGGAPLGSATAHCLNSVKLHGQLPVADPRPNISSISCSFSENLAKSYVGAPPPPFRELASPPTGNPGSAPAFKPTALSKAAPLLNTCRH